MINIQKSAIFDIFPIIVLDLEDTSGEDSIDGYIFFITNSYIPNEGYAYEYRIDRKASSTLTSILKDSILYTGKSESDILSQIQSDFYTQYQYLDMQSEHPNLKFMNKEFKKKIGILFNLINNSNYNKKNVTHIIFNFLKYITTGNISYLNKEQLNNFYHEEYKNFIKYNKEKI